MKTRHKNLRRLGAFFLLGLLAVFFSSDATPRNIKTMNAAFHTHVSKTAMPVVEVKKTPSFFGDGVSYALYRLNDADMAQLKKDLAEKQAYGAHSDIGGAVLSALSLSKENQASDEKRKILPDPKRCKYYSVDRSPGSARQSNYDALVVDEKAHLILYLVYDS